MLCIIFNRTRAPHESNLITTLEKSDSNAEARFLNRKIIVLLVQVFLFWNVYRLNLQQ